MTAPFLLIGLGNPGKSYAGNRHNIGFMALDCIREDYGFRTEQRKFGGLISEGTVDGQKALAFKPMGYMNTSGIPSQEAAHFYKIPLERIIVIHDELDLPFGKLRVKSGGGHGGHNGLKSIDAHLGQEYTRLRLGIGHPGDKDRVSEYVLSDFNKDEKPLLERWIRAISDHIGLLLQGDHAGFMNRLSTETKEQ